MVRNVKLLPHYIPFKGCRSSRRWFQLCLYTCLAKISWTLCMLHDRNVGLPFMSMVFTLIPLVIILNNTSRFFQMTAPSTIMAFEVSIRTPCFLDHCGDCFQCQCFREGIPPCDSSFQIIVAAWFSLLALASVAIYYIGKKKWVVPCMMLAYGRLIPFARNCQNHRILSIPFRRQPSTRFGILLGGLLLALCLWQLSVSFMGTFIMDPTGRKRMLK